MTENLVLLWSKHSTPCAHLGKYMKARKITWNALCIDSEDVKQWCYSLNLTVVPTLITVEKDSVDIFSGYNNCTQFLKRKFPRARNSLPPTPNSEPPLPSKSPPKKNQQHERLDPEKNSEKPVISTPEFQHTGKTPDQINRERLQQQDSSPNDGGFKRRVDAELIQQQHTAGLVQKKAKESAGTGGDIVSKALQMQKQREASL